MADPVFDSALGGSNIVASPSGSAIDISEIQNTGLIDLRILPKGRAALTIAANELGFSLPHAPRTSGSGRGRTALWWSIDQWIVTCPRSRTQFLAKKLETAFGRAHAMVTNVSDTRAIVRVSGDQVREVLMKGCCVDLLAKDVVPGLVRRTQIAEIPAAIHFVSNDPLTFDIYVFRSYADYIWQWLAVAGRSSATAQLYGLQPAPPV
jgi:sarcosine oxidase, subunit gamma